MGERHAYGEQGEAAAVALLEGQGWRVRHRNFRCRYGELDVVAERGDTLCFVEVRARSSAAWGDPSQTVSWAKQRRVVKAALHYLAAYPPAEERMVRFDVIAIVGRGADARLEHLPAAFDAGM